MIRPQFIPLPVVALIDVLHRAWDGVDDLSCRGYLDPDWENWQDIPLDVVIELAPLAARCELCRIGPSALAEHWISCKQWQYQEEHERSLPTWTCDCGHLYKVELAQSGTPCEFYEPCGDGLLGPLCAGAAQPGPRRLPARQLPGHRVRRQLPPRRASRRYHDNQQGQDQALRSVPGLRRAIRRRDRPPGRSPAAAVRYTGAPHRAARPARTAAPGRAASPPDARARPRLRYRPGQPAATTVLTKLHPRETRSARAYPLPSRSRREDPAFAASADVTGEALATQARERREIAAGPGLPLLPHGAGSGLGVGMMATCTDRGRAPPSGNHRGGGPVPARCLPACGGRMRARTAGANRGKGVG